MEEKEESKRQAKKKDQINKILLRQEERKRKNHLRRILKKSLHDRTVEEATLIAKFPELVSSLESKIAHQFSIQRRMKEIEDTADEILQKCEILAKAIAQAKCVVVYTGAGISTAAQIPDYRGPNGVWTCLRKGKEVSLERSLANAEPTFAHRALAALWVQGMLRHVVSQNCDGLHRRSGLPPSILSELHGNMYIEVCPKCKKQYIRPFDVTGRTAPRRHATGRECERCGTGLRDTIVHFGERGSLRWPLNWEGAVRALEDCDLLLCLGSSLKVLKSYKCLWQPGPQLYIVNLQWTPKDHLAELKINGRCDDVMKHVMKFLEISVPDYVRENDPFLKAAIPVPEELTTPEAPLGAGWYGKGYRKGIRKRKIRKGSTS